MNSTEEEEKDFKHLFQVYSDLHLDDDPNYIQTVQKTLLPKAPFLLLAGDISKIDHPSFSFFFEHVSSNWEEAFYVLGNHEFYHSSQTYTDLLKRYKAFFSGNGRLRNVHLLEKECCIFNVEGVAKFKILGCTLWSCVPNQKAFEQIGSSSSILKSKEKKKIDLYHYNLKLNRPSVRWLVSSSLRLAADDYDTLVVLTHFPVTSSPYVFQKKLRGDKDLVISNSNENIDTTIIKLYRGDSDDGADDGATDQRYKKPIYFVSGHTHYSYFYTSSEFPNVFYVSNQRGNTHTHPHDITRFEP